jgi:hypothetical protein
MKQMKSKKSSANEADNDKYVFDLYVTGASPKSLRDEWNSATLE